MYGSRVHRIIRMADDCLNHMRAFGLSSGAPNVYGLLNKAWGAWDMLDASEQDLFETFFPHLSRGIFRGELRIDSFQEQLGELAVIREWESMSMYLGTEYRGDLTDVMIRELNAVVEANYKNKARADKERFAEQEAARKATELRERTCPECGRVFSTKGACTRHVRDSH